MTFPIEPFGRDRPKTRDGWTQVLRIVALVAAVLPPRMAAQTEYAFSAYAGSGGESSSTDGIGPAASFCFPTGVAADGAGNLYVSDGGNNTIRKITPAGVVTTLAGAAGIRGYADGSGSAAIFLSSEGIAVGPSGNLYVADGVSLGTLRWDWRIAGVGDCNDDGQTDILWQNTVTGSRCIWLMNGAALADGVSSALSPPTG